MLDKDGSSPLYLAASRYWNEEIIQALVEKGADVNAENNEDKTSRDLAEDNNIKRLLKVAKNTTRLLGKIELTSAAIQKEFLPLV